MTSRVSTGISNEILAERAIDGEQEALEYLQHQETALIGSKNKVVTCETICSNYNCAYVYIVAAKLGLHILGRTFCLAPRLMNWIARDHYRCKFPSITTTCTINNLVAIMSVVL